MKTPIDPPRQPPNAYYYYYESRILELELLRFMNGCSLYGILSARGWQRAPRETRDTSGHVSLMCPGHVLPNESDGSAAAALRRTTARTFPLRSIHIIPMIRVLCTSYLLRTLQYCLEATGIVCNL